MALTKGDKEWVVRTIKDLIQPIDSCLNSLRISIFGETGDNGINGRQKESEKKLGELEAAVITMTEQMKQIRSTAIFWTRLVGGAALMAIGAVLVKLLLHQ